MEPNDQVDGVSQKTVITLADELGRRLKRDIGAEIEELLDRFFKEMKETPQRILQESGAQQDRIFKLLDERPHSQEDQGTQFEQELERLMKTAETRLQEKIEAEKKAQTVLAEKTAVEKAKEAALARVAEAESRAEQALREKTQAREKTAAALARADKAESSADKALNEKRQAEEKTAATLGRAAEAEKKSHVSDLLIETLKEKLKSAKKVSKTVAVILSIITLTTAGYVIFSIQSYHTRIKGIDGLAQKLNAGIGQKETFIDALNQSQAPLHAELDALKQNVTLLVKHADRLPVTSTRLPESKTASHRIAAEIYFDSGYIDITADNAAKIMSLTQTLKNKPKTLIRIEGHTDDKALRWPSVEKYADNIGLSQARAAAMARLLIKAGVAPGRISIIGLGATRPLVPNNSPENRAKNRRVAIKIAGP